MPRANTSSLTAAQKQKRRERNARRRAARRVKAPMIRDVNNAMNRMAISGAVYPMPGSSDTGFRRFVKARDITGTITSQGMSFLKCAFAPPDFAANDVGGVPDDFRGASIVKKHRGVFPLSLSTPNVDTYVVLAPVPGVAYWTFNVPAGTPVLAASILDGVNYSDFTTMFGGSTANVADIVTKFRYVSNHIELVPTVNQMQWSGNIQAWKIPLQVEIRQNGATPANLYSVTGLNGLNSSNANQYTGPTNLGVYCGAYNAGAKFDFAPLMDNTKDVPQTLLTGDFGQLRPTIALPGFDNNFESIVIKISGYGANVNNSFIIKTWACVEYQVLPGNLLYEFSTVSPASDPVAMKLYREIILSLPVGVAFYENDTFWQRVLGIIKGVSGALSVLPGPYGMIAGGVNSVATGLRAAVY